MCSCMYGQRLNDLRFLFFWMDLPVVQHMNGLIEMQCKCSKCIQRLLYHWTIEQSHLYIKKSAPHKISNDHNVPSIIFQQYLNTCCFPITRRAKTSLQWFYHSRAFFVEIVCSSLAVKGSYVLVFGFSQNMGSLILVTSQPSLRMATFWCLKVAVTLTLGTIRIKMGTAYEGNSSWACAAKPTMSKSSAAPVGVIAHMGARPSSLLGIWTPYTLHSSTFSKTLITSVTSVVEQFSPFQRKVSPIRSTKWK